MKELVVRMISLTMGLYLVMLGVYYYKYWRIKPGQNLQILQSNIVHPTTNLLPSPLPTRVVNITEAFKVPTLPKGTTWTEINRDEELDRLDMTVYNKYDSEFPRMFNLRGKEWYSPKRNAAVEFEDWLIKNGWNVEAVAFSVGNYDFYPAGGDGPGGSVSSYCRIVGNSLKIVTVSEKYGFYPETEVYTKIFISEIMDKDELIKLAGL